MNKCYKSYQSNFVDFAYDKKKHINKKCMRLNFGVSLTKFQNNKKQNSQLNKFNN